MKLTIDWLKDHINTKKTEAQIVEKLNNIGLEARVPKAGMYIWAKIPEGYSSVEFADDLLEQVGVVVTPGTGYGKSGEGYVRLSLTVPDAAFARGLSRLSEWQDHKNIFKPKKQEIT